MRVITQCFLLKSTCLSLYVALDVGTSHNQFHVDWQRTTQYCNDKSSRQFRWPFWRRDQTFSVEQFFKSQTGRFPGKTRQPSRVYRGPSPDHHDDLNGNIKTMFVCVCKGLRCCLPSTIKVVEDKPFQKVRALVPSEPADPLASRNGQLSSKLVVFQQAQNVCRHTLRIVDR